MKKVLNLAILSLMFLVTGCAGMKKDSSAPAPSNLTGPTESAVKNSMRLLDRIQYGKIYVGEVGDVSAEVMTEYTGEVIKAMDPLASKEAREASIKEAHDKLIGPSLAKAEVKFSKEGELNKALAKDEKDVVICEEVNTQNIAKEDTPILGTALAELDKAKADLEASIRIHEKRLGEISGLPDEEKNSAPLKAEAEDIQNKIAVLKKGVDEVDVAKAEKATKVTIESETRCYTLDKNELDKEIDSGDKFSQSNVTETIIGSDNKTASESSVTFEFEINKDGSAISNGTVDREGANAETGLFSLILKEVEGKVAEEKKTDGKKS